LLDLAARCESLEKWVFGLWLLGILAMFTLGQWVAGVQSLGNVRAWPLGLELAAVAPVSGSLSAIWAAFYWLEERLHWLHRGQRVPGTRRNLLRFLWLQARQQLGLLVVPPLALAGLVELATRTGLVQEVSLRGQTAPRDGWWVVIVPLGIVLGMPVILRRLWKTTPLPEGPLRQELLACCQAERCPVSEVLLWHTGMRQANAAVVGLVPRLRYVLISDRLLALLTRGELLAVLRHELSHLKRGHLLLRLAVLVLPAAGWLVVGPSGGFFGSSVGGEGPVVATRLGSDPLKLADQHAVVLPPRWASLGFPVAMLAYCLLVVGGYSRWLEHEADLEACLDAERRFDPWAAEDLADALRVVVGREEGGWLIAWLHPPLSSRLAFLRRAASDAAFVRRFRWRLKSAAVVVLVLWLAIGWMAVRGH
jgi:Zn-dependent protease with chaperone function